MQFLLAACRGTCCKRADLDSICTVISLGWYRVECAAPAGLFPFTAAGGQRLLHYFSRLFCGEQTFLTDWTAWDLVHMYSCV